jgi:hypothetical protein
VRDVDLAARIRGRQNENNCSEHAVNLFGAVKTIVCQKLRAGVTNRQILLLVR